MTEDLTHEEVLKKIDDRLAKNEGLPKGTPIAETSKSVLKKIDEERAEFRGLPKDTPISESVKHPPLK